MNAIKTILTLAHLPLVAEASIATTAGALCFKRERRKTTWWDFFLFFFNPHQTSHNLLPFGTTLRTSNSKTKANELFNSISFKAAYKDRKKLFEALRWNHNVNNSVKYNVEQIWSNTSYWCFIGIHCKLQFGLVKVHSMQHPCRRFGKAFPQLPALLIVIALKKVAFLIWDTGSQNQS